MVQQMSISSASVTSPGISEKLRIVELVLRMSSVTEQIT